MTNNKEIKTPELELNLRNESLDTIMYDEQNAFDNMPDSIQCTDRGAKMEENIGDIDELIKDIDDFVGRVTEIIER